MKSPWIYLLETMVCSGLFLIVYRLLLERHVSFRACRRYLPGSMAAAALIPLLGIPVYPSETIYLSIPLVPAADTAPAAVTAASASADWAGLLLAGLYLCGAALLLSLVVRRTVRTLRLRRASQIVRTGGYVVAYNREVESPFSFLSTIYLGDGFTGREREQVLAHEASHILHRHSQERMAMECLKALLWFNPFVWMASRSLVEIQEFEADADVLSQGHAVGDYRMTILKQIFGVNPDVTCGLNCGLNNGRLVRRFAMMTGGRRRGNLRLLASLPVLVGTMMAFGFTVRNPRLVLTAPQADGAAETVSAEPAALSDASAGVTARGTVSFDDGTPVAGAIVAVPGTAKGVTTDAEGRFGLQAEAGSQLEVIYVNAAPAVVRIPRENPSELSVVLPRPADSEAQRATAGGELEPQSPGGERVEGVTVYAFGSRSGGGGALPGELPEAVAGAAQSSGDSQAPRVIRIPGTSASELLSDSVVVIDDELAPGEWSDLVSPGEIAGIEIRKDAQSIERYCKRFGIDSQGKSGVIVVTTRRKK